MPFKDPEKNKAAKLAYALKNAGKEKLRLAEAYQKDKENWKARSRKYYKKNKKHVAQRGKVYRARRAEYIMWVAARYRAKKSGVACDLAIEDIVFPEFCPVLGIKLERGSKKWADGSPSLDRIVPELGYTKGNVRIISWRANNLKRDGTAEEFERIAAYIRGEL